MRKVESACSMLSKGSIRCGRKEAFDAIEQKREHFPKKLKNKDNERRYKESPDTRKRRPQDR